MKRIENIDAALQMLLQESGRQSPLPLTLPLKQQLLRALMNVRQPLQPSKELLRAQDAELQQQRLDKGVVEIKGEGLHLWRGDITRLKVDAIVNAANSALLGCFIPLHNCIDNAIHSAAGIQLRCACNALMQAQRHEEPTGQAKITPGFNLPARYVLHTVGPIIPNGVPTLAQQEQLASCYRSCLQLAESYQLTSIAFCCISTGVFHFPQKLAAEIAVRTVKSYSKQHIKTIVFNVFTSTDEEIYRQLL
ncbi:protein-ADP-ribose hydrolase [Segatella oulorum]|uniref:protein-ADP-ribose hydrolase n=1 Tax=Segatella oulorum TaxID=28136 RepID=UPI0028E92247|nr:protein-ADP-ribose hydrolase [Segatella oulorum]